MIVVMAKAGYRPATLREFLSLGAQFLSLSEEYDLYMVGRLQTSAGSVAPCILKDYSYPGMRVGNSVSTRALFLGLGMARRTTPPEANARFVAVLM